MLSVEHISEKGRILVATAFFRKGQVITRAPAVPFRDRWLIDKTSVFPYYFERPGEDSCCYLVFGLASIASHSDEPNARVVWSDDSVSAWMTLVAVRDIPEGAEVMIRYQNIEEYWERNLLPRENSYVDTSGEGGLRAFPERHSQQGDRL